jgi:hypothetical protein
MSVILDVLKKLDREKPSRRSATPDIAAEILKPDLPRSRRRLPLYIGIVSITAIITAVVTFGLIKEFEFLSKSSPPAPPHLPATSRQAEPAPVESTVQKKSPPPAPVIAPALSQQVVTPAPPTQVPVREIKEEVSKVAPKTETPPESKVSVEIKAPVESKPIAAPPEEKKVSQGVIQEKKEVPPAATPKKSPETPATESATTPPTLKLSAIVWYEDPSQRFAIVNGQKAVEGSLVEGAKVVEIHRTSVRFLHNNQYFEVSMPR